MRSAAWSTSRCEKKMALGLPVVPLEVWRRLRRSGGTATKPVGVVVAEIRVGGEGESAQVLEGPDGIGRHPGMSEAVAVKGDVGFESRHGLLEALELECLQGSPRHGFEVWLPVHGVRSHVCAGLTRSEAQTRVTG